MMRLQGRIASRMSAVGLCALAPLLSAASPVRLPAEPGGQIAFTTPSNNIGCTYTPAGGSPMVFTPDPTPSFQITPTDPDGGGRR